MREYGQMVFQSLDISLKSMMRGYRDSYDFVEFPPEEVFDGGKLMMNIISAGKWIVFLSEQAIKGEKIIKDNPSVNLT